MHLGRAVPRIIGAAILMAAALATVAGWVPGRRELLAPVHVHELARRVGRLVLWICRDEAEPELIYGRTGAVHVVTPRTTGGYARSSGGQWAVLGLNQ